MGVSRRGFLIDEPEGEDQSMQESAEAVGVIKAAPYHHFTDKERLFGEAFIVDIERNCAGVAAALAGRRWLGLRVDARD
jgi:AcrR family transcriptional regulator